MKKAQQRLYFLRQLWKFKLPQELLKQFYSAIFESVLCMSITVWFSSATKSDLRRLRRVVRTAERFIGTILPTLQELYSSRLSKRAGKITLDPSHPAHSLFELLPSGRRYRALSTRMTRHRNSFFPQAIHLTHYLYTSTLIYPTHILRVNPNSLSYPFPLPLPLSFARSRESKGCPNSRFELGVVLRGRGRYPLKPRIFASLLETKGYPEHTAARSSRVFSA